MSRSFRKHAFYSMCGNGGSHTDKTIAARSVRRLNRELIRTTQDFEEYSSLLRYECTHNDVWSWNRDGNKHYLPINEEHPDPIIEISILEQVERVLDGKPAINKPSYNHDEWYRQVLRK